MSSCNSTYRLRYWNNPIPDIETNIVAVATVLTVYGIETLECSHHMPLFHLSCNSTYRLRYWNTIKEKLFWALDSLRLQQYLPFTVLKLTTTVAIAIIFFILLQQYLPFTVLKRYWYQYQHQIIFSVATVLTVYGIETTTIKYSLSRSIFSCNSTYRLRYWNLSM